MDSRSPDAPGDSTANKPHILIRSVPISGMGMWQRVGNVCTTIGQPFAAPGAINYPVVDPFTLVHAAVGVLCAAVGVRLLPTVLIAVGWEIAEHLLKNCAPDLFVFPTQDTVQNALGDIAATVAGWLLLQYGRSRVPRRRPSDPEPDSPVVGTGVG